MTQRTREKIAENLEMLCKLLDLPYNPRESHPDTDDPRVYAIANALVWTAEDVEEQCRIAHANSRGRNNAI